MYSIKIENNQVVRVSVGAVLDGYSEITELEYQQLQESARGSMFAIIKGALVIMPPDAAVIQAQAIKDAANAVKTALQSHIDSVAVGLGFSGGNALMLYAGFTNDFQPLAQSFGAWEAGVWIAAGAYMVRVKAGEAPMLPPAEAVALVPPFQP